MSDDAQTEVSDELGSMASLLEAMARTRGSPALPAGTLVADQYEVESVLGEGGMGVVYLTRDRKLDRAVAVKLGIAVSPSALARIEREARSLARLAHPNVVVVYQVGTIEGRVFIAMEHVGGGTARQWREAQARSWRDVIALYGAVGDGLAAAHAAGIVHRDFKPDNVLVGSDGRPRIADFGVAHTGEPGESGASTTSTIVGTPAYMPPEQRAGEPLDARADQYAYAVTVWEALFGARPETDRRPEDDAKVPRRIVVALRRALSPSRDDRWPELAALIAELRAAAEPRRKRALVAGGVLAALAVTGVVVTSRSDAPDDEPCGDAAARIADVWNLERRGALARVAGPLAWPAIERAIDVRVTQWIGTHAVACKATRVDRLASEALLDRRMFCLETAKAELHATLHVVEVGRMEALARVVPYLADAAPPSSCLATQPDEEPPPAAAKAAIDAAVAPIAEAQAATFDRGVLDPLGKTKRALALARATGWRPLIAKALSLRGWVLVEHERFAEAWPLLDEGARLAVASRSDRQAVYAMSDAAQALAELGRIAEAQQAVATARSLWERIGEPPAAGIRLWNAIARLARLRGKPEETLAAVRKQVELTQRAYGDEAVTVADNYLNLAGALADAGKLTDAATAAGEAVKRYQAALGDHPTVGKAHFQAGGIATRRRKLDDALAHATASVSIYERWYGNDDARLVPPLLVASDVHRLRGKLDLARPLLERALAIVRSHDPSSIQVAQVELGLAILAFGRGDLATASRHATAALASAEALRGADHLDLIDFLMALAAIERDRSLLRDSEDHLLRAQRIAAANLPDGHRRIVNLAIELSYTQVKAGKSADAIAALEPWFARLATLDVDVQLPHELAFALAKAHHARNASARACELAARSEAGYAKVVPLEAKSVAAWRAKHCR